MKETIKLFIGNKIDEQLLETLNQHLAAHYKLKVHTSSYTQDAILNEKELVLLYLTDDEIKSFLKKNMNANMLIGIIPNKFCPRVMRSYGIVADMFEALDDIFERKRAQHVDVLFCNDEITFNSIIIGNVHGLNQPSNMQSSIYFRIKSFFSNLVHLSFVDYNLVTSKGQSIETAATGIMILEHSKREFNSTLINEDLSLHDGKLNALILAPSSIFSYLHYLVVSFFYHNFSLYKLPRSIGVISTSKLDISSSKPLDFIVDGVGMSAKNINLEVKQDVLYIQLGRLIQEEELEQNVDVEEKDIIKVATLPKGDMRKLLVSEPVPLFKKADEDEFKELFVGLKQNAVLSTSFVVLMVLSTLLATTGLFQSSAPVIIGAMILAPLMAPIISLSMGVARGEQFLIRESVWTLVIGVFTALAFSSLYTFFMPLTTLTDEMNARLNPNILDLMVAIISGIAGAYANSKSEIAKSLAGVAIAVALVPPLSVTGIGIGYGEIDIIYGSFLLFITNLVGITLAATMTFLVLGYAPIYRAKKGILYTSVFLALVSVPLVISFTIVLEKNEIIEKVKAISSYENKLFVNVVGVDLASDKPNIAIEVLSDSLPTKEQLLGIKRDIEEVIKKEVTLEVTPKIRIH